MKRDKQGKLESMFSGARQKPQEARERTPDPLGHPDHDCCVCGSYRPPEAAREVTKPCPRGAHAKDGGALEVRRCLRCPACGRETGVQVLKKRCVLCDHERYSDPKYQTEAR